KMYDILGKKIFSNKLYSGKNSFEITSENIDKGIYFYQVTAGNKIIEEAIYGVRQAISEGKTMAEPLAACGVFPPMVVQMIEVGESTGALDNMLNKIADFYEEDVDTLVTNLTAMMEPMIMMFLGVILGGLIVAMYLPIFKLGEAVH
ncbi:MAG: type II secretion system F family protein, partial [Deltaproteobacteria bacterium]